MEKNSRINDYFEGQKMKIKCKLFDNDLKLLHHIDAYCTSKQFYRILNLFHSNNLYSKSISFCWYLPE